MTKITGIHEKLEVHELLTFKNLCVTKSLTMSGLVNDEELKTILSNDVKNGTQFINQLKDIITNGRQVNE